MNKIKRYIKKVVIYICVITTMLPLLPLEVTAAETEKEKEADYKIVVSLGDSFSSGESIEEFYGQNKKLAQKVKDENWLAHRSTNSWPGRLKIQGMELNLNSYKDRYWYFEAVSGAKTNDIAQSLDEDKNPTKGQQKDYSKNETIGWGPAAISINYKDRVYMPYQIEIFDELEKEGKKVDYVTMTLGGNDAEFVDIIRDAVLNVPIVNPNALKKRLNNVLNRADIICAKLKKTYELIADEAGSQAKIIVAGYPKLLDPKGSGFAFSEEDAKEINDAVVFFNKKIKSTVNECARSGMNIHFVSVEAGFENHGAYSDNPYINRVYPGTKSEDLKDLDISSAYSMHPNSEGARVYYECVQRKINELEGERATTLSKNFQLIVFDDEQEQCSDYRVSIVGEENVALWGLVKKDYYDVITVEDDDFRMSLPEGTYTITVRIGDEFYDKEIKIRESSKEKQLIFYMDYIEKLDPLESFFETDETPEVDVPPERHTSGERDIVLALDVSGSMGGTPIDETKKASNNFINTILQKDASIGCVAYDDSAVMRSDFSIDQEKLKEIVNGLGAGGGTNIEAGLQKAAEMLDYSSAKKRFIVLMSDGEPNNGKVGDELIQYANILKDEGIYIYTIGFFEEFGNNKSSAQSLMEAIASDGCHYEVSSAEELVFFFEDIADQIDGKKYVYVRIACPVDVTVTHDEETLCSSENALNTRTGFGTLTFEDNIENATEGIDNRIKILRLKEGVDYDIQIEGTGNGYMNYTIGFMGEDGEYSDLRKFNHIKIRRNTLIDTVATADSDTILKVDEDGDGKYDLKYKAEANGRGKLIDYTYLYYIGLGGVVGIILLVILLRIKNKNRKTKER